jgi:hypothetical protein
LAGFANNKKKPGHPWRDGPVSLLLRQMIQIISEYSFNPTVLLNLP